MTTESLFQIIDRMEIALLKSYHYEKAGNKEAASMAMEQADNLRIAGDLYIYECYTGKRKPYVHAHLRFHDHRVAEGKWQGKKSEMEIPTTIMQCVGELALVHARYWDLQTSIQTLKKMIDGATELRDLQEQFVKRQREIDLCNQQRNELIQRGDMLFAATVDK